MLLLLFQMGEGQFALEAKSVVEIVPLVDLQPVPKAPAYVAGLFNYRGRSVPVIDMCQLNCGRECRLCMTTRIILVDYAEAPGETPIIGLRAEQVTEIVKISESEFASSGITLCEAGYLGEVSNSEEGLTQLVKVKQLLAPDIRELLYNPEAA